LRNGLMGVVKGLRSCTFLPCRTRAIARSSTFLTSMLTHLTDLISHTSSAQRRTLDWVSTNAVLVISRGHPQLPRCLRSIACNLIRALRTPSSVHPCEVGGQRSERKPDCAIVGSSIFHSRTSVHLQYHALAVISCVAPVCAVSTNASASDSRARSTCRDVQHRW
jgi:hypothetical protein